MIAQFILALALFLGASSSPSLDECDVDLYVELEVPGAVVLVNGVEHQPGFLGAKILKPTSLDGRYDVSGFAVNGDWIQLGPLYMKKTGLYGCRALRFTSSDAVLDARGSSGTVIY